MPATRLRGHRLRGHDTGVVAMPLQNRVDPFADLFATPARGTLFGNRGGRFHTDDKTLTRRRWASRQWICCVLDFKGRQRDVWGRFYTELFFLDEVTALAAGHRPCFECRRKDAEDFAGRWQAAFKLRTPPYAPEMDEVLHAQRLTAGPSGCTGAGSTACRTARSLRWRRAPSRCAEIPSCAGRPGAMTAAGAGRTEYPSMCSLHPRSSPRCPPATGRAGIPRQEISPSSPP